MSLSTKHVGITVATVLLVVVATVIVAELLNPWRGSDATIRARLLQITPLGSHVQGVQSILDKKGWHQPGYQQTTPVPAQKPFLGGVVGGYQGLPWYTNVRAFWEFDELGRLRNIKIDRIIDSP